MLIAEVGPQYIDEAEETVVLAVEQEVEARGERINPDDVPYIMARGSLLGRIAAKKGLLVTVDSANADGITFDAPLAIDLRREIKVLKRKVKALSVDTVSLKFTEPNMPDEAEPDEAELLLLEKSYVCDEIEETRTQPSTVQNQLQIADEQKTMPWSPFSPTVGLTSVRSVKAAPGAPICTDTASYIDTSVFYSDDKHRSDEEIPSNNKRTVGDWRIAGLCVQTDPEAFFPEKGGSVRESKKICVSCEVKAECLTYAVDNDERFGVWGGLSERERRTLRRKSIAG